MHTWKPMFSLISLSITALTFPTLRRVCSHCRVFKANNSAESPLFGGALVALNVHQLEKNYPPVHRFRLQLFHV